MQGNLIMEMLKREEDITELINNLRETTISLN